MICGPSERACSEYKVLGPLQAPCIKTMAGLQGVSVQQHRQELRAHWRLRTTKVGDEKEKKQKPEILFGFKTKNIA